tara:strand:+ start:319 stop:648 length:330 start_codon:yes stop_codon:yes gene_type:complete
MSDILPNQAFEMATSGIYRPASATLDSAKSRKDPEGAAKEFEAFFIANMLDQMYAGLEVDGMFGGGEAEKTYRGLLHQEYGKSIAEQGGIGVGKMVSSEIIRMQELANQ